MISLVVLSPHLRADVSVLSRQSASVLHVAGTRELVRSGRRATFAPKVLRGLLLLATRGAVSAEEFCELLHGDDEDHGTDYEWEVWQVQVSQHRNQLAAVGIHVRHVYRAVVLSLVTPGPARDPAFRHRGPRVSPREWLPIAVDLRRRGVPWRSISAKLGFGSKEYIVRREVYRHYPEMAPPRTDKDRE